MSAAALCAGTVRWNNTPDCRDRAFWSKVKAHPQYQKLMQDAEAMLKVEIISPQPWYLECSRNGNRVNYEKRLFQYIYFGSLVTAYCTTGEERFLRNIEARIKMLLSLPSWVLPAHDRELKCYRGEEMLVDLFSARLGGELATTIYLLEPVMNKELAAAVKRELFRRIVTPTEEVEQGKSPQSRFWWLSGSNNWNPVCKQGIIGTVLRLGMEKERVDKILNLFLSTFEPYFKSFGDAGYCDEGLSYWGGSCGEYLRIAAVLKQYDQRDILSSEPRMLKAVMYPENIMMAPGFYPAYTDCSISAQPGMFTLQLRDIMLGKRKGFNSQLPFDKSIAEICMTLGFDVDETPQVVKNDAPYTKFTDAGCFVVRQMPGSPLSVSFKGGNNRESHNHNDVGVYTIAVDGVPVVLDPGGEIYTARTFGAGRYESKLLSSYGHSVPRIDGELQTNASGHAAFNPPYLNPTPVELIRGVLLSENFTPDLCTAKFDISRVYNHIKGIEKLERSFEFDRKNGGRFTVTDCARFARKMAFDNAVITLGKVEVLGNDRYKISYEGKALLLEVKSSVKYNFSIDTILEDTYHKKPVYRLSFAAEEPCSKADMSFVFTPAE